MRAPPQGGRAPGADPVVITLLVPPREIGQATIVVSGAAFRHLFRARRLAVGAEVRLVDGRGRARWSRVTGVTKSSAELEPGGDAPHNEPARRLELITPVPKPRRLDWLVEKSTEIGVAGIRLIRSQRAPRDCGADRLERLRRVAAAAVEQCHRSVLPDISGVHRWDELGQLLQAAEERWFLEPRVPPGHARPTSDRLALIVGPEGGWTDEELAELALRRCSSLGLGPTILRVETAAVVGSATLLSGAGTGSGAFH